mgnify:CR=1 FL=1
MSSLICKNCEWYNNYKCKNVYGEFYNMEQKGCFTCGHFFPIKTLENVIEIGEISLEKPKETVNHPNHYNKGGIEVIDFIEDWKLDFTTANIIKYVVRAPYKNNALEDLKKAKFYLERLINRYEESSIQK